MGSGKSAIGREVALCSGGFLLDTDLLIEQKMGRSVREIFDSVGESGFRRIESQLITWLCANVKNAVIATGGGMPIYNDISCLGTIFWLDVSFDVILSRLDKEQIHKRPLFSDIAQARTLYENRKSIYRKQAQYTIDGDVSSLVAAEAIMRYIKADDIVRVL